MPTLAGNLMLTPDFREFLQSLNKHRVQYLVVGGYAVALHGYPRFTKDIDIWIWIDAENASNLIAALSDFGFASLGLTIDDFLEPGIIVQLGYPPNRIDLITGLAGVEFSSCYESRIEEEVDGIIVPFIDLENLRKNKKAAGRLQDLADLENLQ